MNNLSLKELYALREKIINEGYEKADVDILNEVISREELLLEDTSGTGGASVGCDASSSGMGDVSSPQPSSFSGLLNGPNWMSSGGTVGSGDISVPYNPGGGNRMFQKVPLGKNHGPSTGKKSRSKKIDLKSIRKSMKSMKPQGKVMNFNSFSKSNLFKVTKVKEGRIFKGDREHEDKDSFLNRKEDFRNKVRNIIESNGGSISLIGNDFLVSKDTEDIFQVMFRDSYIAIKRTNEKYSQEFKYNEFGKLKLEIIQSIKK